MKKALWLFVCILALLSGCGKDSEPTAPVDNNAYLKITNSTAASVDVTFSDGYQVIEAGHTYTRTYTSSKVMNVDFSYSGTYVTDSQRTVQVSSGNTTNVEIAPNAGCITYTNSTNASLSLIFGGGSYTIPSNSSRTFTYSMPSTSVGQVTCVVSGTYYFTGSVNCSIYRNTTTTKYLSANAGAINIANYSSYSISSVYLSPSSDPSWGTDDLTGYLYSGYNATWTTSAGLWDIRIESTNGYAYNYLNRQVVNDNTYSISFYGSKNEDDGDSPSKFQGGIDSGRTVFLEEGIINQ